MNGISGIFSIFSLIYVYRGVQLLSRIWREWAAIRAEPLTRVKKQLAEQASFFVAVPPGVFIHELFHALAIWLFGGQVVEFGYRVFWGFVVPDRTFPDTQQWFISLAGTLGTLVFGLGLFLIWRNSRSSALRYFSLRSFRYQVFFGLVYYPVFTLFLPIGDWATIYDFGATPMLSGITAVSHLLLLLLFWQGDRIGWFEQPAFASIADAEQFEALKQQVTLNPHDTAQQLLYIDLLRRGDARNQAKQQLKLFIDQNPTVPEGYLQRAALNINNNISRKVVDDIEKALQVGLSRPNSLTFAYQTLGRYYLEQKDGGLTAVTHFTQALETATEPAPLHQLRSLAYRRLKQYDLAYKEINQAIQIAQNNSDNDAAAHYQEELKIIEHHAGRSFSTNASTAQQNHIP